MKKPIAKEQQYATFAESAEYHRKCQEDCNREAIMEVDATLDKLIKQFTVYGEYSQLQTIEGMMQDYLKQIHAFKMIIAATLVQTDADLDPKAAKQVEAFKQFAVNTQSMPVNKPPQQQPPPVQKVR